MEYQHIFLEAWIYKPSLRCQGTQIVTFKQESGVEDYLFSYFVCNFFRKVALENSRIEKSGP